MRYYQDCILHQWFFFSFIWFKCLCVHMYNYIANPNWNKLEHFCMLINVVTVVCFWLIKREQFPSSLNSNGMWLRISRFAERWSSSQAVSSMPQQMAAHFKTRWRDEFLPDSASSSLDEHVTALKKRIYNLFSWSMEVLSRLGSENSKWLTLRIC